MGRGGRILIGFLLAVFPANLFAGANDTYIQQTITAIDFGALPQLRQKLNAPAVDAVGNLGRLDASRIDAIASCRQFAGYFGSIPNPTSQQKETMTWLAMQPRLMPTLMSAVSDRDSPDRVLDILQGLRTRQSRSLDDYADLTTALAVVWDKPSPREGAHKLPKFPPDRPARLFAYFTDPRSPMRFDIRQFCWQLDLYIVDIKVSDDEIQWAGKKYANNYSIGSAYFDVTYDDRAFFNGDAKKISTHPYTLQNLLQYGGVCVEQAYYAEEVAKSLGIPACMCTSAGGGAGQAGHAWLGLLDLTNRQFVWDFDQGRYQEDLFWSADIVDPQTGETLSDADVGLLGALQKVDGSTRLLSAMLLKLTDDLLPARRFDIDVREIEVSPGNRPAWAALADMGAKGQLGPAQIQIVDSEISRFLLQAYPDFACQTLIRMDSGQSTSAQVSTLDRVALVFPTRPDLRARVRLRQAKLLMEERHDEDAFRMLNDVLAHDLNAGAIVLEAITNVDKLMRAHNNLPGLARVYGQTWSRMPSPDRSSYAIWTPYYTVGKAYMKLLESLGDRMEAENVRNRLMSVVPYGADLH